MITTLTTKPIRTVYCPHCNLSTRANSERCLHCGTKLPQAQTGRSELATLALLSQQSFQQLNSSPQPAEQNDRRRQHCRIE
jgi:hypothetical protein